MDYGGGQYSTTSYGAQGGAGGGGFMGGSQGGSQSNNAGKGTYGKDTLRPVTIMQVLQAQQPHPDADFSIDDVEITQVTFIGQIRNISTQPTNTTYQLDDGTGVIEVKQWLEKDDMGGGGDDKNDTTKPPPLATNDWARVWGRLKAFNNKRHVGAHVIRPVPDKMEITHHLLEATYVHLYFTRGPLEQFTAGGATAATAAGTRPGGMAENGDAEGGAAGPQLGGLSVVARRVYQMLKSEPQNNEGLHVHAIAARLRLSVPEVVKGGDELLADSLIFPTVDDQTWALLEF